MNALKERILGAVTVMNDSDAEKVWRQYRILYIFNFRWLPVLNN